MRNTTLSDKRNQSLMMDFYELTMSQVYFDNGTNEEVVFDLFYRRNPDNGGFAIFCGLDQIIDYVENFSIDADMIEYLRSTGQFSDAFWNIYLLFVLLVICGLYQKEPRSFLMSR